MTTPTHDQHTESSGQAEQQLRTPKETIEPSSGEQMGSPSAPVDSSSGQMRSPAAPVDPATRGESPAAAPESMRQTETDSTTTRPSSDDSLFAGGLLSGFRSRWDDVQATFVDDPRECVQKADHLVSDVVDRLTGGFADARARLEEQWSRGEEVSTEQLRVALKQYREFFDRLLSV